MATGQCHKKRELKTLQKLLKSSPPAKLQELSTEITIYLEPQKPVEPKKNAMLNMIDSLKGKDEGMFSVLKGNVDINKF